MTCDKKPNNIIYKGFTNVHDSECFTIDRRLKNDSFLKRKIKLKQH